MTSVAQPAPQSQISVCFWKVVEMRGPFKSSRAFALRRNYYFRSVCTVGGSRQCPRTKHISLNRRETANSNSYIFSWQGQRKYLIPPTCSHPVLAKAKWPRSIVQGCRVIKGQIKHTENNSVTVMVSCAFGKIQIEATKRISLSIHWNNQHLEHQKQWNTGELVSSETHCW